MSERKLVPDKIEILNFRIVKGNIESPWDYDTNVEFSYSSNVNIDMGFNIEQKLARTNIKISIETDDNKDNTEEAKAFFEFLFFFQIENLEDLIDGPSEDDHSVATHNDLQNALVSITYSTARGVLMSRLQGTIFDNFILPIVDPNTFVV
jgi:hypothetical protein